MDRKSFITGSRAYGKPRPNSDIDLVVYLSEEDLEILLEMGGFDTPVRFLDSEYIASGGIPLRIGKINLICVVDDERYKVWKDGTDKLKKRKEKRGKPIEREEACKLFARLRHEAGLQSSPDPQIGTSPSPSKGVKKKKPSPLNDEDIPF